MAHHRRGRQVAVPDSQAHWALVSAARLEPAGARAAARRVDLGGGGFGGFGGGGGFRPPMTVEVGKPTKGDISAQLNIVGNLIGAATVDVVPRTAGRLVSINVKLGDRVTRGQLLAKIEDQEINEQVKQAEASNLVAQATIRQREADLKFAEINLDRSQNLFQRQLLPRQSLDDAEARQSASTAQLDLSRAQFAQSQARLEELRIAKGNTISCRPSTASLASATPIPARGRRNKRRSCRSWTSARCASWPMWWSATCASSTRATPRSSRSTPIQGESFKGRIARVAPVLDPATRTAEIEIEVPNATFRLKPGMYARMSVTIDSRTGATLVPKSAVVDYESKRGVFTMTADNKARFQPVEIGIEDNARVEARNGVAPDDTLVTSGASSLRNGDTLVLAGQRGGPSSGPGGGQGGAPGERRRGPGGAGAPAAGAPAVPGSGGTPPAGDAVAPGGPRKPLDARPGQ